MSGSVLTVSSRALLDACARLGLDTREILAAAGIGRARVADPDARLSNAEARDTRIDDASSAWNDTFVHPDSTHWLYEGSGLAFPGLTARAAVTKKVEVGAYFTKNPNANYGFYGGQVQYNLVDDAPRNWAAAARVSFVKLYGPEDLDLAIYGIDVLASREYRVYSTWAYVSPYAGVSGHLSRSHEKTAAVELSDEQVFGAQAMVGAVVRLSKVNIAFEYSTARVQSRSLKVGVSF